MSARLLRPRKEEGIKRRRIQRSLLTMCQECARDVIVFVGLIGTATIWARSSWAAMSAAFRQWRA